MKGKWECWEEDEGRKEAGGRGGVERGWREKCDLQNW